MALMLTHLIACLFLLPITAFERLNELNLHLLDSPTDSLSRSPYIIMMNEKPLLSVNPDERRDYHEQLRLSHIESMNEAGVDPIVDCTNHYFYSINGYSAFMSEEQSQIIAQQPNIKSIVKDSIISIETDASPQFLELTSHPNGAYTNGINGEGVVIGILDSGIWPEHPSFRDDGTFPPPPTKIPSSIPCNFGNTEFNPNDIPFNCNNKILGARRCMNTYDLLNTHVNGTFISARDDNSHGTHVSSTAAGNSNVQAFTINPLVKINLGKVSGIAHRAQIIAYKVFSRAGGGTTSDITQCIDFATMDKVDVINFSVGGGIHTFISNTWEAAFFEAVKQGVFAVKSAGNSGLLGWGSITSPGGSPWLCTVAASTQPRQFNAKIRIKEIFDTEKHNKRKHKKQLTISNGMGIIPTSSVGMTKIQWVPFINGGLCGNLSVESVQGKIILCKNILFTSPYLLMDRVREMNGLGLIYWTRANSLINTVRWFTIPYDMLFATVHFEEGQKIEQFLNELSDINNVLIKVVNKKGVYDPAPAIAYFSSTGPNRAAWEIIKPDITAPGFDILAGISPNGYDISGDRQGELFWQFSGTSTSAPHITGIGALIKQVHKEWGPDYIKSAIMTTAYQDGIVNDDLLTQAGVFDYGSGHVNPGNDFNVYSNSQSIINPGLVYPTNENDYNSALCQNTTALTPQQAVCDDLLDQGYTNLMRDLNQPNIG
eukprot:541270_1